MLTAQKPINRPGWWKGKFALFRMLQVRVWREGGRHLSEGRLPPPSNQWGKSFYRQSGGWGATRRNSTVISNNHLQSGHQWSDQHHLGGFRSSSSSVPGSICPHFFVTNSQNCGSSCPRYSHHVVSLSTWRFSICKTAHRIWLSILSAALEKELKLLDYA